MARTAKRIWPRGYTPALVFLAGALFLYFHEIVPSLAKHQELKSIAAQEQAKTDAEIERAQSLMELCDSMEQDVATRERVYRELYPHVADPGEVRYRSKRQSNLLDH